MKISVEKWHKMRFVLSLIISFLYDWIYFYIFFLFLYLYMAIFALSAMRNERRESFCAGRINAQGLPRLYGANILASLCSPRQALRSAAAAACTAPTAAQPPCRVCFFCRVIKIITSAGAKHLRRSGIRGILKNRPGPRRGGG